MKLAKTINILQNIKKKLELKRAKAHIGLTRGAIEWWAHIQQATFEQLGSSLALVAENLKQIYNCQCSLTTFRFWWLFASKLEIA